MDYNYENNMTLGELVGKMHEAFYNKLTRYE